MLLLEKIRFRKSIPSCKKLWFVKKAWINYIFRQLNDKTQTGDIRMNNANEQIQDAPLTLSMMISEVVFKAVVGVERLIHWLRK